HRTPPGRERGLGSTGSAVIKKKKHGLCRGSMPTILASQTTIGRTRFSCQAPSGVTWKRRGVTPLARIPAFFPRRRRNTRLVSDWSSDVCSSDLGRSADSLQHPDDDRRFHSARHGEEPA